MPWYVHITGVHVYIIAGRSQLVALLKTQNQQSRLEKALTQQERDIRHLQQAHDLAKSGTVHSYIS